MQTLQGLTLMFVDAFADLTGRRPAYMYCSIVCMAANVGCALASSYVSLLVLRMLQSAVYVSYISLPTVWRRSAAVSAVDARDIVVG